MKLPERNELPCSCYVQPDYEGCTCGNYDDANSQGYAQGWNDCLDAIVKLNSSYAAPDKDKAAK